MKTDPIQRCLSWKLTFHGPRRLSCGLEALWVAGGLFFLGICGGLSSEQAFVDSVTQVNMSFHWDHTVGNVPQPASTTRVPLTEQPTNLTTINFDASDPSLYSTKLIGGTLEDCMLVSTYTRKTSVWLDAVPGQDLSLHNTSPSYDIFSWVSAGSDLKSYFATNYAATLTSANVDRRISQTLGMEDRTGQGRVLAFFWAPIQLVLRPAYSADITTQISYSGLTKFADGSYQVADPSAGGADYKFQDNSYTTYTGVGAFGDFAMNNEAKTVPGSSNAMPWTAMGYTYNWNYLEDGQDGRALDPFRVGSYVGTSEFIVSAGVTVQFDHFVESSDLYSYLVPEPGSVEFLLLGAGLVCFLRLRRPIRG